MSNTDGLLINNNNIYGLVNPPPVPDPKDKAKSYQDPSSAAVRWDYFVIYQIMDLVCPSSTDLYLCWWSITRS